MSKTAELDQLVTHVYDGILSDTSWREALTALTALVGGASALVYLKPRNRDGASFITSRGFDPSYRLDRYLTYYEARSPLLEYFRDQAPGTLRALGTYAFSESYRETEYFQDWVRPQGFADILGGHLVRSDDIYAWLSVRRSEKRSTFKKSEIRLANFIAAHMNRAIRLRSKLDQGQSTLNHLRQSLDVVAFGVLVVDVNSRIIIGNRVADDLLRAGDTIAAHHNRLVCKQPGDTTTLHKAIRVAAGRFSTGENVTADLLVTSDEDGRALIVHVVPACGLGCPNPATSYQSAAVYIIDPARWTGSSVRVATAYGLTAAESRVLEEILAGSGVVGAALNIGIATATARTHLQHVFEKTGTASQAELVRLVMMSPLSSRLKLNSRGLHDCTKTA